ncbi:MAG: efflux RND transporter periplasmic adaptor subunit [Bdellovibrionia bacterium]
MRKIFYVLIVTIFVVATYFLLRPEVFEVEAFTVTSGEFIETLNVEGRVRSQQRQIVYAFATGTLSKVQKKVGDSVKKGDVLAELDWDKQTEIKSPISGVVTKVFRDSYGPINRGEPLIEISSLKDLEVVVDLLTPEVMRLKVGVEAQVHNWGGEGSIQGTVSKISQAGVVKISALGVEEERTEVIVTPVNKLDLVHKRLGDNYHIEVTFYLNKISDAISVPLSSLVKEGSQWSVFVINSGKIHKQVVNLGAKNQSHSVVVEGLRAGDLVVQYPSDQLKDGVRVKF